MPFVSGPVSAVPRRSRFASIQLASPLSRFLASLWIWVASCALAVEPETPDQEFLARLLDRSGGAPLAMLAIPDLRRASKVLPATRLGRTVFDPQYEAGRTALLGMLAGEAGLDAEAFWRVLQAHAGGPAVVVLTAPKPAPEVQALQVSLLVLARDRVGAEAIAQAWESLATRKSSPVAGWRFQALCADDLAKAAAPSEWARSAAPRGGLLRLALRPREWQALQGVPERPEGGAAELKDPERTTHKPDASLLIVGLRLLRAWPLADVERAVLDVESDGENFTEQLRLEFREGAASTFARLLLAMRAQPQPWKGLASALPGGHDVSFLAQAEPAKLVELLPVALQVLERKLRGKQWTRKFGEDEEAQAPERYRFFTGGLTGTFGLSARPSLTGEVRTTLAAALSGQEVEGVRAALTLGLEALGGTFQTQERAPRIGRHAPLAATFQGRSFLPAPVIGLSDGWCWLCSNTGSYGDLTAAFASGKTLAAEDASEKGSETGSGTPPSALRLRVNLNSMVPMLYAAWILSEQGPRIGTWKVPDELLHPKDLVTKGLGILGVDLAREGNLVSASARGPAPGGALWVVGWIGDMAAAMDELSQRRATAVRKKLEELDGPAPEAAPVAAPEERQ